MVFSGEKRDKAHDGATLDIVVDEQETLPHGLVRLRSGAIAITHVFCPNGHNLVDKNSGARFNGYPGISVVFKGKNTEGVVVISPIHGDDTRFGETHYEPGEVTQVCCPTCGVELPSLQECGCTPNAHLVGLFLDENLSSANQVAFCNAWGCLRSRITDRFQIISKLD